MNTNKHKNWNDLREEVIIDYSEELIFIGELGVAAVVDGKLPDGSQYTWTKRRKPKKLKNNSLHLSNI